jgi:KaiC/GvpD/RAD55 family RecA-like ATPase
MVKAELIERSPLRALEKSIHGGLGSGNIGVLASPKGVGKTACLVHIAADKLFQGKHVIHVSYSSRVDYIINWYEDIFKEIAKKQKSKSAIEIQDEVIKNRVIMNFKQEGARTEQVLKSVEAMIFYGKFTADAVIVDGYDFIQCSKDDLKKFKEFARRMGLEVWFSASLKEDGPLYDEEGVPCVLKKLLDDIDVLITLHSKIDHVRLRVVKDRDFIAPGELRLKLDPKTLLIK